MDKINWKRVNEHLDRSKSRSILKPYGLPDLTNPFTSEFSKVDVSPKWDIPELVSISVAITGGFFMRRHNQNQPISDDEIIKSSPSISLFSSFVNFATFIEPKLQDSYG